MGKEESLPTVKSGYRNIKETADLSHCITSAKIRLQNGKDEGKAELPVGNNKVRKDGMRMPAGTAYAMDGDQLRAGFSIDQTDNIALIGAVSFHGGAGSAAGRAILMLFTERKRNGGTIESFGKMKI